jgi:hypothetical protein
MPVPEFTPVLTQLLSPSQPAYPSHCKPVSAENDKPGRSRTAGRLPILVDMRWSLAVFAGLAGLLLGGPGGAVFAAVVTDAAVRLAPALRSRP